MGDGKAVINSPLLTPVMQQHPHVQFDHFGIAKTTTSALSALSAADDS